MQKQRQPFASLRDEGAAEMGVKKQAVVLRYFHCQILLENFANTFLPVLLLRKF